MQSVRSFLFSFVGLAFVACAAPQASLSAAPTVGAVLGPREKLAKEIAATDCGGNPQKCGETSEECSKSIQARWAEAWRRYPSSSLEDVSGRFHAGARCVGPYQRQLAPLRELGR